MYTKVDINKQSSQDKVTSEPKLIHPPSPPKTSRLPPVQRRLQPASQCHVVAIGSLGVTNAALPQFQIRIGQRPKARKRCD